MAEYVSVVSQVDDPTTDFHAGQVFLAKVNEACQLEISTSQDRPDIPCGYLLADPVIDGLVYFRHFKAPDDSATHYQQVRRLKELWELYVTEDNFGRECPGMRMIGLKFQVLCWKDFQGCKAGKIYDARIVEFFGFGTDGFSIQFDENDPDRKMEDGSYLVGLYVDTLVDAINHFVLA